MFNINWEEKIEMTNKMFAMVLISWSLCGFIFGLLLGIIT